MDGDIGLAVDAGGEVLGSGSGNCRVALDDFGDRATEGLDTQRKRRDVKQQHLFSSLGSAGKNIGLNGRAEGDDFVGVEIDVRLFAARA